MLIAARLVYFRSVNVITFHFVGGVPLGRESYRGPLVFDRQLNIPSNITKLIDVFCAF